MDNSDLKRAFDAIMAKRTRMNLLEQYYAGNQPTVYLTERLRELFRGVDMQVTANWCAVVVDSCKERINLRGFESAVAGVKDDLARLWKDNELALESDDIHLYALVFGEAYLMAWREEGKGVEAYYNDPRMVEVIYAADNPRVMRFAAKMWTGEDTKLHMTLYYPERLEYYVSNGKADNVSSASQMALDKNVGTEGQAANPFGVVPVFHFRTDRRKQSDLANVTPLQNGVNKLLADMLVAAEYGAYKQRYVISDAEVQGKLKSAPGEIWDLPAGDGIGQGTSVGEFSATELKNYLDAIDTLAGTIGKISRTPKHYFYAQGGDPSGEALIALESPLNKKAQDRIERFTPVWQRVAEFMLQMEGKTVAAGEIEPVFDQPETIQPRTRAEIVQMETASGVPLETSLRWSGRTEAELEILRKDLAAAAAGKKNDLANAMLDAERNFNAGEGTA
jgi:hypothetical protein